MGVPTEKLIVTQQDKICPDFYVTRMYSRVHKSPPLFALLNHMHPLHTFWLHLPKICYNITFPSMPRSSEWFFPSGFPTKILYEFLVSHACYVPLSSHRTWFSNPMSCVIFHKGLFSYVEFLALCSTPKLEDHPSSAVRDCLFNTFPATLHILRPNIMLFVNMWCVQISWYCWSRTSWVSIVTRLRAGWAGIDSRQGQGRDFLSSPPRPDQLWGSPSLPSNGCEGLSMA
jgi:hypothetical protein